MASTAAVAYEQGDILVKGGVAKVSPDNRTTSTTLGDDKGLSVDSDIQLGLTLTYMYTDNIGVELLAATPFDHNINGAGPLTSAGNLGSTKHLPPTVTVNYYPLASSSKVQPYVGAGINYTHFFDTQSTTTLDNTLVGPTDVHLKDSWGLAAHAGIDYEIGANWSVNAAVWYIDIDTTATLTTGSTVHKIGLEIDPMVYMVGLSYKF